MKRKYSVKKIYNTPKLHIYGDLVEITKKVPHGRDSEGDPTGPSVIN